MAARPLWSGQLRLSLVSMAVDLYSAPGKKKTAGTRRKSTSRKKKRA